jgi:biotin synthase
MDKQEIINWLTDDRPAAMFAEADRVRRTHCGDGVYLRGIIEFSNYCKRDCLYCGLRKSNGKIHRYRLTPQEIIDAAKVADGLGYGTVVLQSGEDSDYSISEFCRIIETIKKETKCAITMAVGELKKEDYAQMKAAGADRYLLKIETTNPKLFKTLKPDSDFDNRLRCLRNLKELGFQVGSGAMIGLLGQTLEDIADDILFFKQMEFDMIGIGPFIAHPNTPLNGATNGTLDLTLRAVALTRIITKNTHIPATTAVGTIDKDGRQKALKCGANIMMPNATPPQYRKYYEIYPDKICIDEKPSDCQNCITAMLASIDRHVATGWGDSLRRK